MSDVDVEFTPEAMQAIGKMRNELAAIGGNYGDKSVQYTEAAASMAHALLSVFGLLGRGGRVICESFNDHPGIAVLANGLYVGMVFHRKPIPDEFSGIEGLPEPGTWSLHS